MSAFDKVIGYEAIKNELLQICDMIRNRELYASFGAKLPQGILLYGEPGLGKTLMAKCFIAESGLKAYTLRRNKGTDDFVSEITETFRKAKDHAPAVVFLDDMDKFANEDEDHRDAEEYASVQAGIDEVKSSGVFVLATANNIRKLPRSLKRSGRFDRKIEVCSPTRQDACDIIRHYLQDKRVAENIDLQDVAMMINYSSCAELETILNEAAIRAAFQRKKAIEMEDLVEAVLRTEYEAPDKCIRASDDDLRRVALHEAGHLVISEVLCPGSVGLASLRSQGRDSIGGFIRLCREPKRRPCHALIALGGKAAVELYYGDTFASGCQSDLQKAAEHIRFGISSSAVGGIALLDICTDFSTGMSEAMNARSEAVVHAELERYLLKVREILLKNRDFLVKTADALVEKETLLYSDIRALRESVTVTEVAV